MSHQDDNSYTASPGELCPSCNEYLLDGESDDVVDCPVCGALVTLE